MGGRDVSWLVRRVGDALPMLRAYLLGDDWFGSPDWHGVSDIAVGIRRQG